jgi:hypothetical protein
MFLQISPSYRLAHLEARGRLRVTPDRLPTDFDAVREVYKDLGNVYYRDFGDWWFGKAQLQFGHDNALPLMVIDAAGLGSQVDAAEVAAIAQHVSAYLTVQRDAASSPAVAVVGVPLYADKAACMAALREVVDGLYGNQPGREFGMPYKIATNKRTHRTMIRLLQLVWLRIGMNHKNPRATAGHRIMSRLGLTIRNRTTPSKARSQKSVAQAAQRHNATIAMHARLREAYRISENAARGVFPYEQKLVDERTWDMFMGEDMRQLLRRHLRFEGWQEREEMRKHSSGSGPKRGHSVSLTQDEFEAIIQSLDADL